MADYTINYEDEIRRNEEAKEQAITESNQMYDQMINDSQSYYQNQIDAVNEYSQTQQDLQNEKTEQAINEINQQKEYLNKDYQREQRGAYSDWQKESNRYGANAEQMAASGLANTGYSESSQVAMYNQYQNRVATARESYQRAVVDYDNAIANARISNNAALAEIAYQALQSTLELSLQGFQYKNQLLQTQLANKQALETEYYGRYKDLYTQAEQVRQYNESLKEQQRQYNTTLKWQKEQAKQAQKNWEKEYALSLKASSGSSRSSKGSSSSSSKGSSGTTINKGGNTTTKKVNASTSRKNAQGLLDNFKTIKNKANGVFVKTKSFNIIVKNQLSQAYQEGRISDSDVKWVLKQLGLE